MFRFDFAISYAGEEEGIAKDLYRLLKDKGAEVFLAANEKVYLLGKSLRSELDYIFGPYTKYAVAIVSKNYVEKYWPKYEFNRAKVEQKKRGFEFILPIHIDNVILEGLEEDLVYVDLRKEGILGTAEIMMKKLRDIYPAEEVVVPEVWVATYGLTIENLLEKYQLPSGVPRDYPHLCDWLEKDLIDPLSKSLSIKTLRLLEDSRNGETLSVRVGFKWNPETHPLDFSDIGWWELLELVEFNEIYPDQDWKVIFGG